MLQLPTGVVKSWERCIRLIVVGSLAVSGVGLILGFTGHYRPVPLVVLSAVVAGGLFWLWERLQQGVVDPHDDGLALVVGVLGIAGIAIWHALHSGQFLFVSRDPAFYVLGAARLAQHGDLTFPGLPSFLDGVAGIRPNSQAFAYRSDGEAAYIQSFHGLGALIAPLHWLGGINLLLKGPALVGGLTLMVLRRLLVRFTAPWTATALVLALGVSVPYLAFTRDPYSEPFFLLFVAGAMLALVEGDATPRRWLLVGAIAGAASFGRIDALLVVAGFVAVFGWTVMVVDRRRLGFRDLVAFGSGIGTTVAIGYGVGAKRSPDYFSDLAKDVKLQVLIVGAAVGFVIALWIWVTWLRRIWSGRGAALRHRAFAVAPAAVVAAGVGWWILAPILFDFSPGEKPENLISGLQAREGAPIDSARTYGEESLLRLSSFYGEVVVLAAILGAGLLVSRALRRDKLASVALIVGATMVPYLVVPRIAADLPWAMRRFLPVVIPLMLLLAGVAIDALRQWSPNLRRVVPAILCVVVGIPATVSQPVWGVRTAYPTAAAVNASCDIIPPDGVIFLASPRLALVAVNAFETVCNRDTVGLTPGADPDEVVVEVAARVAAEGRVLAVIVGADGTIPTDVVVSSRESFAANSETIQRTLERTPVGVEPGELLFDVLIVPPDP